ncbi:MAG: hypothetical protein ABUJ98_14555 [Hyphomicrobium sp.]
MVSKPDLEKVRERHKTIKNFNGRDVCYQDNDESPCDAIQLADEIERLREAGSKLCEAFDKGIFIRSTKGDGDPAWAIKLLPYLRALAVFAEEESDE